jgi:hypothetical protein
LARDSVPLWLQLLAEVNTMQRKDKVDIINEVLEDCILAYPLSTFIISLYKQYQERGSLSKKQLQGLYGKASKIKDISQAKLGTLEAIIKKMPTRYKSELPAAAAPIEKEDTAGRQIQSILEKYPQHKRVLFFKSKYDNNEPLTPAEIAELNKFEQLLARSV